MLNDIKILVGPNTDQKIILSARYREKFEKEAQFMEQLREVALSIKRT